MGCSRGQGLRTPLEGCSVYLKQIEMENFKSFGGKLTIPLMEGYMAVTGPNGSGKSNITDAILFVLGPKSSKAIRAGKLTDLIFDGGKSKNKAEFTRVSLVFENSDRMIPWDSDLVKLTRHVKVSPSNSDDYSSYFYVNDRKSSMTEFDSLLTRARISAEGYNMVQQGDVTRIVQMGNLDRRRVVDGISGIASYDADISKAQGEKQEAQVNLERIGIVMAELEKQLAQLEKDMESAKKYLAAQGQLDIARAQLTLRQLEMARESSSYTREQLAIQEQQINDLRAEKDRLKKVLIGLEDDILSKEAEIEAKIGPEYRSIKDNIEEVKVRIATFRDRAERASDDNDNEREYASGFEESLNENEAALQACIAEISDAESRLIAVREKLDAAKAEDAEISQEMSSRGGEHTALQMRLEELERQVDESEKVEHDSQVRSSKAIAAAEEAARVLAVTEEQAQSAGFEIKDAEWNLQQVKAESGPAGDLGAFSKKIMELKAKESSLERQKGDLDSAVRRLSGDYNALLAEKKVSDRTNSGSTAVAAVLALRDKGAMKGVHGTLQELATVDPEFETALSVAAGSKMQAVVVDDDDVAAEGISFLKRERLGRVTFLPMTKMMGGKPRAKAIMVMKETRGYAMDLIDYDQRYKDVFWFALGDTLVVDNLSDARRIMGGVRIVTKAGELIEASGAMVGGTINTQHLLKFGPASESKLDSVASELRAANSAMETLDGELRDIRNAIRDADNQLRAASVGSAGIQEKIGRLEGQIKQLKETRERAVNALDEKRKLRDAADKELRESAAASERSAAGLKELRDERTSIRDRISEIAPAGMQERIGKVRQAVYDYTGESSQLVDQVSSLKAERKGIEAEGSSIKQQLESVRKKIETNDGIIADSEKSAEDTQLELDALRIIERDMEGSIKGLRDERDGLLQRKYSTEGDRARASENIETKVGFKASLEASLAINDAKVEELEAEAMQITIEVPEPLPSEDELRRTVRACESTLSRIGNVNLRAIDDYNERKTRYDGLTADVDRLNVQIKELDQLTDSLSGQKRGLFMKSYDAINANFKEIYSELSGGGEAYMHLEYEDDPFVGGLMINAKPRNGKLLRLESLSGGEKSLTALAFIFAIQKHQPSPFYVLDEVDMFLDAVNAEMVAQRVKKSSAATQFIQVSLRKVTLALADHLIGVTRQPSGISKVIMQPNLEEVSKYEAEALKKQKESEEDRMG
jgi:chromosome segregation protein